MNAPQAKRELLPCPFCGAEPYALGKYVRCRDFGFEGDAMPDGIGELLREIRVGLAQSTARAGL